MRAVRLESRALPGAFPRSKEPVQGGADRRLTRESRSRSAGCTARSSWWTPGRTPRGSARSRASRPPHCDGSRRPRRHAARCASSAWKRSTSAGSCTSQTRCRFSASSVVSKLGVRSIRVRFERQRNAPRVSSTARFTVPMSARVACGEPRATPCLGLANALVADDAAVGISGVRISAVRAMPPRPICALRDRVRTA